MQVYIIKIKVIKYMTYLNQKLNTDFLKLFIEYITFSFYQIEVKSNLGQVYRIAITNYINTLSNLALFLKNQILNQVNIIM